MALAVANHNGTVPNIHEPLLVNTVGHAAGTLIFGIFLVLFLRDRAGSGLVRGSWLSFAAAGLAFLWDTISLAALVITPLAPLEGNVAVALSFAVLSLLPAVLLHLSMGRHARTIVAAGYALAIVSAGFHLWHLIRPEQNTKQLALILIPLGFGILTSLAVVLLALRRIPEGRSRPSRIAGAMCLFLFAISFVHFATASPNRAWSSELMIHHAGIPIALFVLLQDYRFVLLDALVRFFGNVLLAGLLTFATLRADFRLFLDETKITHNPLHEALLLISICLLLIGFALLRTRVQKLLTNVVFRRPDLDKALQTIRAHPIKEESESEYFAWGIKEMSTFVRATRVSILSDANVPNDLRGLDLLFPILGGEIPAFRTEAAVRWAEAVVPLRFSHGDVRYVFTRS